MLGILVSIIQIISWGYVITQLMNKKINITKVKNMVLVIIMILCGYLLFRVNLGFSKTIIAYCTFTLCYKYIYEITLEKSIILNFVSFLIHGICEILIAALLLFLIPDTHKLEKYMYITPLSGILMLLFIIIIFLLFKNKLIKIPLILKNQKENTKFYMLLLICLSILFSININDWNDENLFYNIMTISIFVFIIILLFVEKYKIIKKEKEFDELLKQSQSIASLLQKYQKINHENNNDLRIIRSKISNNKDVREYIDEILDEKNLSIENKWINELNKIKDKGIYGFLSLKLNKMIDSGISVYLIISNKIKEYNFNGLNKKEYKELCRILGVYLDNAHDASVDSKEKEISIEILSKNKNLEIIISNTFNQKIQIEKLDNYGYTTKGKGHGIGLTLVNDIISKSKIISQKRKIIKNYYFQFLYINKK